ncbi:MAG: dihydrofolate reductase [Candidatus Saccharibacteria bacterium]|nr:dihydrofolate reductase [Candidatus Saccharibacteria bacterium]
MMVTANGYFEGENHDISWHNARSETFQQFAAENLANTDTLVFGRRTYDLMAAYWPGEDGIQDNLSIAKIMNESHKVAFTHTPLTEDWQNVETSDNVEEKMTSLKNASGKDIAVLGSSNLCVSLLRNGLIDELRIMINPVTITAGTPLFEGIETNYDFTLKNTRTFDDGNVLLTYSVS